MPLAFLATWAHCWLMFTAAVNQHPQVLFPPSSFPATLPKPAELRGVIVTQAYDTELHLVEVHTIGLGPSIQTVQIPLQGCPALQQINAPTQVGGVCKLTEGIRDPVITRDHGQRY
ncbi:integral membrane protein dgcr2 idd [Pitangus sulphuratus]|nr:integral membrane protein dgcr2 idd [Pitangus sulphuratus]